MLSRLGRLKSSVPLDKSTGCRALKGIKKDLNPSDDEDKTTEK